MAKITTRVRSSIEDSLGTLEDPATEETLEAVAGLVTVPYDSVTVNYTDATKEVIDTIIYKLGATIVATVTATYPSAIQEIYIKT